MFQIILYKPLYATSILSTSSDNQLYSITRSLMGYVYFFSTQIWSSIFSISVNNDLLFHIWVVGGIFRHVSAVALKLARTGQFRRNWA